MISKRQLTLAAIAMISAGMALHLRARELEHPDGHELIGHPAPPLELKHWLNTSQPLEMSDLRGKVVLLRWWTQGCPYCEATAPALRTLERDYGPRGFQVIGVYHPKPAGDWDMHKVEQAAKEKQFAFPVALDAEWTALKRWWLDQPRDFTSVSFLVDKRGIIRYVQPGGEFHAGTQGAFATHESCQRDYSAIRAEIDRLLTE